MVTKQSVIFEARCSLKELVILLFECVVGKCFVVFYVFSFPSGVYVGTLNLIASYSYSIARRMQK